VPLVHPSLGGISQWAKLPEVWPRSYLSVSHCSSAFLRAIRVTDFVTQFTAILHAGSLVSCHDFRSQCVCFNSRSRTGRSLFKSESVTLLVGSLYVEVVEAVKSRAALSASARKLISTLGDINSEARL
jgi:hypothetical protein